MNGNLEELKRLQAEKNSALATWLRTQTDEAKAEWDRCYNAWEEAVMNDAGELLAIAVKVAEAGHAQD